MTKPLLILDAFLPYRLSYTSNLVSEAIADAYRRLFGLTVPEWRVIAVVAEGDTTQARTAERTRMDKVTVSRATLALVARGLIERRVHQHDRRARLLALTGEGRALYEAVAPKALELEARVFGGFERREVAAFTAMLRKIDAVVLGLDGETLSPG